MRFRLRITSKWAFSRWREIEEEMNFQTDLDLELLLGVYTFFFVISLFVV